MSSPRRLTYANVVSTLALVVAVGGGGAAVAAGLQKNSVGSPQIKNGQVKSADLGKNSVTSAKIKKNQVTGAAVKESTLGTVPSAERADNVLVASVGFDGSLKSGRSQHATSAEEVNAGFYKVTFDRDVTACAHSVSLSYPGPASPAVGEAGVAGADVPNGVYVATADSTGSSSSQGFTVIVVC